ncbi:hypothetical protein BCR36DRAFT_276662, partial [Piromyces finnis]
VRSYTSFLNKDNIPISSSATTKNAINSNTLYKSLNSNNLGFNSSNLMYNKPLLSPTKENISKILNPDLKSNLDQKFQRTNLGNSNYDNIKTHFSSSVLDLGNKTTSYNPISSQNKENIEPSTIPLKTTTSGLNSSLNFNNHLTATKNISTSSQPSKTTTSVPLKSNYF